MPVIRGTAYRQLNIPSGTGIRLFLANPKRAGLYIEVVAGTGNIAFGFNSPSIQVSGDRAGHILAQNDIYTEAPPNVNTGDVWIISANGDEDVLVREDWLED